MSVRVFLGVVEAFALSCLATISAAVRRLKRGASGVVDVPDVADGAVKSKGLDGGRYGDDRTV
jgi:hypothetical protein